MPDATITFRWRRHPGGKRTAPLRSLAARALDRLGVGPAEVGVLICDDATIRTLNRHFRGRDEATDVLSFPAGFEQPGGPPYLGDVAISLETARRHAERTGAPIGTELATLLLHAVVHLAGFDHETDTGQMAAVEARLRRELIP